MSIAEDFYHSVENHNTVPNILYGDTDSLFIFLTEYAALLEKGYDLEKNEDVEKLYNDIIQPLSKNINKYLFEKWQNEVLNILNVSEEWNTLDFKTEILMDAIAFIDAKKRYFVNMLKDDKVTYNPPKIKITGFELVRSDAAQFTKDMQLDIIKTFIQYRKNPNEIPLKYSERKIYWNRYYDKKKEELDLKYLGIPSSWSKSDYKKEPTYVLAARFWNTFVKDELRPGKKSYRFSIKIINPVKLEKKIDEIKRTKKQLNDFQLKEIYTLKNPLKWIREKINVIFVPPGIEPELLVSKLRELGIELDFDEQKRKVFIEKIENFEKLVSSIKKF